MSENLTENEQKNKKKLGSGFKKFWKDFKTFMSKGNVLNLAVAFVMGAAFTKIVNSLVNDLIMPMVSWMFGDTDLANLAIHVSDKLIITWGRFVMAIIEFVIIALFLFILVRLVTKATSEVDKLSKKTLKAIKKGKIDPVTAASPAPAQPAAPVETTESLLKEIRDLLIRLNGVEGAPKVDLTAKEPEKLKD